MMEDFIGTYGNRLIVAVVGVGVALLVLAIILWIVRRRGGSSPFIRGGKNRQPRLQVLDATAVDARRRLVLVRRDNVEHLVMIGGPTDIVIESGIGAIPILRDVRDPQDDILQSLSSERAITSERPRTLPPVNQEEVRQPVPVAAATPAPQPEVKRPPVVAPEPAPRPVAAVAPRPAPPVASAAAPRPVAPATPAPEAPAAPKTVAREPIAPPVIPAVVPAIAAASLVPEPVARQAPSPAAENIAPSPPAAFTPPAVAPEPIVAREPVIDQNSAVDLLDAARERVLPTFHNATPINVTANVAKPAPLAPNENGTVFGDQLTSDFESFLEAEIAKSNATEAPDISLEPKLSQETAEPVSPPVSGETSDRDVQKEMARIFGEMAVTRDR
ncbi:flagellar biosynthetic protein FliO [Agrobacterium sp. rho-13.3]|uniref:flagellar biosynthetic protein FliO n=1 Tax=Agrobacterium sp. rho-13.3 TaxID=3072980 RepID=UPI002A0C08FF|nr:flagellar biosynthetic protein FliO [Agrobacterium sp. rho-13.3]MDX8309581.1 flagellar biosynthetic protein FliO [Agrobacterium sp. rho-13.3]